MAITDRLTAPNGHIYPVGFAPPTGLTALDDAWEILDLLAPGTLAPEQRFLLAGLIAGTIMHHRGEARNQASS